MLSKGNTKLGKMLNWSIPAIKTCPGRSKLCESLCYAASGFYKMANVQKSQADNLKKTRKASFVKDMIKEITKHKSGEVIRLHCAGDLYSAEYADKWLEIVKACPDKVFYLYTRSWREEDILPKILELAELPNIQVWYSVDKETGAAPKHARIKQAYLAVDDDDVPAFTVDLVFREKTTTLKKKIGGAQVCPYEIGMDLSITCQKCRICFKDAEPSERNTDGPVKTKDKRAAAPLLQIQSCAT